MGVDCVGAETDELDATFGELGLELGEGTELGCADLEGEKRISPGYLEAYISLRCAEVSPFLSKCAYVEDCRSRQGVDRNGRTGV